MDINEIAQGLPALGEADLRALKARIDFLLKGGVKAPPNGHSMNGGTTQGHEDPVLLVLDLIHKLCRDHGLESRPLERLKESSNFDAFAVKVAPLMASLGAKNLTLGQLRFVLTLGMNLLMDQLTAMGVPIGCSSLMGNIHRVPGVLDMHFPGYREAGLLKLIARSGD